MKTKLTDDAVSFKNKKNEAPVVSGHEVENARTSNAVATSTGKTGTK